MKKTSMNSLLKEPLSNIRAIVLLSGGVDSTVCATLAVKRHGAENVCALSFSYGQLHKKQELFAAGKVAELLDIKQHRIISLTHAALAGSILTDGGEVPNKDYKDIEGVSPMYVPFRNGLFLSYGAVYALQADCQLIYYGAHSEDANNFAYPDCTNEFNGSMASAIYVGTKEQVRVITPLQWLTKKEIVRMGIDLEAPLEHTYSCYKGDEISCGVCPTCRSRIAAFAQNGFIDPIRYQIDVNTSLPQIMKEAQIW